MMQRTERGYHSIAESSKLSLWPSARRRIQALRGRQAAAEHIGLRYPIRGRIPCVYQLWTIVVDPFSVLSFIYSCEEGGALGVGKGT